MWETVELKDILTFVRGLTYSKKDEVKNVGLAVLRATNIDLEARKITFDEIRYIKQPKKLKAEKLVQKGDILMCTASGSKSHLGKIALVIEPLEMAFGGFMAALRCKPECMPEYLFYVLTSNSFLELLASIPKGANINNLKFSQIAKFKISLPPLAEQKRIVAKLDAIFAEIDKAIEANLVNKVNANRIYSYSIDEVFGKYDAVSKPIGDFSYINYGYTAKASHEKSMYKFLRITDIQEGDVNWTTVPYCEVEEKKLEKVLLHDGDIVFARTGATTGKSFLVENPNNAVFASYLIRLSVNRKKLLPRYVLHYFQSMKYWEQIEKGISGAAQGGFNSTKLGKLRIPIIETHLQEALSKQLDRVSEQTKQLSKTYDKKIKQLNSLKSATLAQELQSGAA